MNTFIKCYGNNNIYVTEMQQKNYSNLKFNLRTAENYYMLSAYENDRAAFYIEFRFGYLDPSKNARRAALKMMGRLLVRIINKRVKKEKGKNANLIFNKSVFNAVEMVIIEKIVERAQQNGT